MGSGIAQVSAAAGYKTIVREVEDALLKKGLGRIEKFLAGGVEKGKVTAEDKDKTLGNLTGTTKLEDLEGCDIVIEAIIENIDEKARAYADARCRRRRSTRSSARTPRRSASPSSRRRRSAPIGSPACTSSIRCR